MTVSHRIVPNLWFDSEAEEAAKLYTSLFKDSKIGRVTHYTKAGHEIHGQPEGKVMTIEFELEGQPFVALNGGSHFKFNEAISFIVQCDTQQEIDRLWNALSADPAAEVCGWLKDKFGLSWQIVPSVLDDMMQDKNPAKVEGVTNAFLKMKKFDIAELEAAYQAA
jgi:predicted 3-demethylubiquinone-9 3-methyltransferase (glyoxalase superfamily)